MAVKAQFIAGQWQAGSGATMSKLAPEDQSLLWQAASAGADDVQAACAAARAAFYPWSHRPLAERIAVGDPHRSTGDDRQGRDLHRGLSPADGLS